MPPLAPAYRATPSLRLLRMLAAVVAALMALLGMQSLTAAAASASPVPLACDPDTVFGISGSNLSAVNVTTGAVTAIATMPDASNGLGVSLGGTHAYAFSSGSSNTMDDYDASTGLVTPVPSFDTGTAGAIRGAVNPVTGLFYYGGGNSTSGGVTTIRVGAYDPVTGTRFGQVATITSSASGSGGDFAFTRDGSMFVLIGTSVERVNQTMPTTSGTATLTTTPVTVISGITASPGLAFAASGYLYANSGSSLYKINPVSGAVVGSAVTMSNFSPNDLASCTYPNTLSGSVDVGERMHAGDQFSVSLSGGGLSNRTGSTSGTGTGLRQVTGPVLGLGGSAYTVTQSMASGSSADYTTAYRCTAGGTTLTSGTASTADATASFTMPPGGSTDVDCSFTNTPVTAGVRLSVALGGARADSADQFTAAVRSGSTVQSGTSGATTTGSGAAVGTGTGTTGATTVVATRPYDLSTRMAPGSASVLGQYASVITCTDANGLQTGLPSGAAYTGSLTVTPLPGADIACTVTATPIAPTVQVQAALAGPRADDADQFAVGLQSAGGSTLAGPATTTGTGSTVTAGTGTTPVVTLTPGQAVTVTGAPTAHATVYDQRLSCTDANGFQSGLPVSSAFSGSRVLAPVAGAALVCTVTEAIGGTTLAVGSALGSARYDDGDQVTVAVRTGGPAGTVVSPAGSATTGGAGAVVSAGTGTTGDVAATPGTAYTITADLSGHAARYGSTITCTDAHGLQAGLPTAAAFAGSLQLTPRAGSAISCAVTTALLPPALTVGITGPGAVDVGVAGTWHLTVPNGGGTTAPGAVTVRLPAGLAYTGVSGPGWTCTASGTVTAGQLLTCTGPDVRGGTAGDLAIDATPRPGIDGTAVRLRAAVDPAGSGAPVDPLTCTGSGTPTAGCDLAGATQIGAGVHLQLDATGPTALTVGVPISYALTVTDVGTGPTGSAVAVAQLPADVTLDSTGGAACTAHGRVLTCTVPGPLAAGDTAVVHVRVTPQVGGGTAVLKAAVDPAGSAVPGDPADCTATVHATGCAVTAAAGVASGIRLELGIDGPGHLTLGVPAPYLVTVTNTGSGGAGATTVALALPAGMRFASATGAACTADGQRVTCRMPGSIPAGDLTTFALSAVPQPGVAAAVRLRGAVDPAGATPADPAACTATDAASGCAVTTALTAGSATLRLIGIAVPLAPADAHVVAGDRVAYRYTVTNTGADDLRRLTISAPGVGPLTCATTALAAGATTTCTAAPYRVTQADVDAGAIERQAVATAVPADCTGTDCATVTSNSADTATPADVTARIHADQSVHVADTDHDGVADAGEVATFTVVLTNTGTITLHGVQLADPGVRLTCPSQTLAVGATMRCTGSRTVTDADVAAGRIRSLATATASATGAGSLQRVHADSHAAVATVPTRIGDRLATTGSVLLPSVGGGVLLLLTGAGLLVLTRRRRRA